MKGFFFSGCLFDISTFQVSEDMVAIWDWVLLEKLNIVHNERNKYSAVLVVPGTFDSRGRKTC